MVKGGVASTGATRTMPTDPSLNTIYLAVFAMLFCLWPCGLVGLILGIQVYSQQCSQKKANTVDPLISEHPDYPNIILLRILAAH